MSGKKDRFHFMDSRGYGQNTYGNYYGTPENPMGTNASFAKGSFICGIISIGMAMSVIFSFFSVPVGAVGLMLGMLSSRKNKNIPRKTMTGIVSSGIGLFIGLVVIIASFAVILKDSSITDLINQYNTIYEQIENGNINPYGSYGDTFGSYKDFQDYINSQGTINR